MRKLHWLRRFTLIINVYCLGAMSTGVRPIWVKIIFPITVISYLVLSEEIIFALKSRGEHFGR